MEASPSQSVLRVERVARPTSDCRASYDRMSSWYDVATASSEAQFTDLGVVLMRPRWGERICEIGCGTGRALVSIARAVGPKGRAVGLDLSPKMAGRTRDRLIDARMHDGRTRVLVGDLLASDTVGRLLDFGANAASDVAMPRLPHVAVAGGDGGCETVEAAAGSNDDESSSSGDRKFDAVFMSFVLELFDSPRIPECLARAGALLRPGGRLVVVALARHVERKSVQLYEWFHRALPNVVDCRPIHPAETIAEAPGFTVTEIETRTMWSLPVEIVTATWRGGAGDTPVPVAPANQTPATALASPVPRSAWQNDSEAPECAVCKAPFSFLRRRHHCRRCGRLACGTCTGRRSTLKGFADPQRVCSDCAVATVAVS